MQIVCKKNPIFQLPSQSLKILWDIKGWKRLLKLPHELLKLRLPFEIGADVGIKSKWEFSFRQQRLEKIQLWLHMLKFEGDEVNVTVSRQLAILTKELGVQDTWRGNRDLFNSTVICKY